MILFIFLTSVADSVGCLLSIFLFILLTSVTGILLVSADNSEVTSQQSPMMPREKMFSARQCPLAIGEFCPTAVGSQKAKMLKPPRAVSDRHW